MADHTAQAQSIFDQFDSDHDGSLTSGELKPWYDTLAASRPDLGLNSDGYYAWFAVMDANQDGSISVDELAGYLQSINYTQ